jgi:hypothetical protein
MKISMTFVIEVEKNTEVHKEAQQTLNRTSNPEQKEKY